LGDDTVVHDPNGPRRWPSVENARPLTVGRIAFGSPSSHALLRATPDARIRIAGDDNGLFAGLAAEAEREAERAARTEASLERLVAVAERTERTLARLAACMERLERLIADRSRAARIG
jgi:hypothetical protein